MKAYDWNGTNDKDLETRVAVPRIAAAPALEQLGKGAPDRPQIPDR